MFLKKSHEAVVVCRTKETAQQRRKRLLPFTFCRLVTKTMRKKSIPSSWWLKSLAQQWLWSLPKQHQAGLHSSQRYSPKPELWEQAQKCHPFVPMHAGVGRSVSEMISSQPLSQTWVLWDTGVTSNGQTSYETMLLSTVGHHNPQPPICLHYRSTTCTQGRRLRCQHRAHWWAVTPVCHPTTSIIPSTRVADDGPCHY